GGRATRMGRLRQLRPARISRATTHANTDGKARSRSAAIFASKCAESRTASRPTAHSSKRMASGAPWSGIRPVQLGIAVSRKPATTAAENHFMDVPDHGREYCRDLIFSREGREPDQNGEG